MYMAKIENTLVNKLNDLGYSVYLGNKAPGENWRRLAIKDCSYDIQTLVEMIECHMKANVYIHKQSRTEESPQEDCNNCVHISVTEYEQKAKIHRTGLIEPHICMFYKTQVFHYASTKKHYRLVPCEECQKNKGGK